MFDGGGKRELAMARTKIRKITYNGIHHIKDATGGKEVNKGDSNAA